MGRNSSLVATRLFRRLLLDADLGCYHSAATVSSDVNFDLDIFEAF